MSAAAGLAWLIWTRHRIALTLFAAAVLGAVLGRALFAGAQSVWPMAAVTLIVGQALVYLPVIFALGRDYRLEATESGFPPRLWHLPMRTWQLVGWPMLWGSSLVCGMWLVLAAGVLRPCGYPVPLWWPGLLLAVNLTWLQTLLWTPFPLPWLRPVVLIPIVTAVSVSPAFLFLTLGAPETLVCGLLAVLILVAYGIALAGVSRARHGRVRQWEWPVRIPATCLRADFGSPARAQRWYEWRRCGWAFPLMVAFCSLTWLASLTTIAQFVETAAEARMFFSRNLSCVSSALCG
jgi:hypothetical protein